MGMWNDRDPVPPDHKPNVLITTLTCQILILLLCKCTQMHIPDDSNLGVLRIKSLLLETESVQKN